MTWWLLVPGLWLLALIALLSLLLLAVRRADRRVRGPWNP